MRRGKGLLPGILLALLLGGCALLPAEEGPQALPALNSWSRDDRQFSTVTRGDLEQWASVTCRFQPLKQEKLRFSVDGREIGEFCVKKGDLVKPGDLLAELENEELDLMLEEAEKECGRLDRELASQRESLEIVSSSADLYDRTERYEKLVAQLEEDCALAAMRLEELRAVKRSESLYAGIEGTVTYVSGYRRSDSGSDCIVISDRGDACFYADTKYSDVILPGTEVILTTEVGKIPAVVTEAAKLGFDEEDAENGGHRVYFVPKDGTAAMNGPDQARLELLLDSRQDVLIVQERAVFFAGGQAYAYYEDENGVCRTKPVELGLQAAGRYEVLSGLTEGEELIVR